MRKTQNKIIANLIVKIWEHCDDRQSRGVKEGHCRMFRKGKQIFLPETTDTDHKNISGQF